jgi:iron complex transport system substrate-binding protein
MKAQFVAVLVVSLVFALLAAALPLAAQEAPANLADGCVDSFDAAVDYFPDKAEVIDATGFHIRYFGHYKVIDVTYPWPGATDGDAFQYVLVQCGTPAPDAADFAPDAQFVTVPAGEAIVMTTTALPAFVAAGAADQIIGLDSFLYVNTPEITAKIAAGELIEVGMGGTVNVEAALAAEPDLIVASGSGFPDYDAHPILLDAGLHVALLGDYAEATMLGRAEWMKFIAAFYNAEAAANAAYNAIAADYAATAALAAAVPEDARALVLWNAFSPYAEAWTVTGAATWAGDLLAAAGADWVLMDAATGESAMMDFETVYAAGIDAPVWVANAFGVFRTADLLAMDERYADFAALRNGQVYNTNGRVNANGGDDFYETGVARPDIVLRDLVHALYPELLPEHEPVFIVPLAAD